MAAAKQYEQVATELNQWLGQVGPELTMLEVLTGRKVPDVSFTTAWGLPGFVDRLDSVKRRDVVVLLRKETTQMQTELITYIQASNSFLDNVSKSMTH